MTDEASRRAQALTYAGALPFVGCALAALTGLAPWGVDAARALAIYGAVIAAFVAGVHWGVHLTKPTAFDLFLTSNAAALYAWAVVVLAAPVDAAGLLIPAFLFLLAIDRMIAPAGAIPAWFLALRTRISAIVAATLALYWIVARAL